MIQPGTTIHSLVTANGEALLDQIYSVDSASRALEINRIWRALDGSGAGGTCTYELDPQGVRLLGIRSRRLSSHVVSVRLAEGEMVVHVDGVRMPADPTPSGEPLFDCDDPMLDWIYAIPIIGLTHGESLDRTVHAIDPVTGMLSVRAYRFEWSEACISIIKSPDPRHDCRLYLKENSFQLERAESGGYTHEYDYS